VDGVSWLAGWLTACWAVRWLHVGVEQDWKLIVKCPGLMTGSWVRCLDDVEKVCGVSGLSLELLEHGAGLGGLWLCIQVKEPAPKQQHRVLCFLVYGLL